MFPRVDKDALQNVTVNHNTGGFHNSMSLTPDLRFTPHRSDASLPRRKYLLQLWLTISQTIPHLLLPVRFLPALLWMRTRTI